MSPASSAIHALWIVAGCAIAACSNTTDPGGNSKAILVAGTYPTAVTLTENTCSGITVQPNTTVVSHTAGSATVSIQHGPITYSGTLASNGSFTTAAAVFPDPAGGTQSTLTVAGQFTTTGFVADVSVSVLRNTPPDCAYKVHWVGTKQGSPNVIP